MFKNRDPEQYLMIPFLNHLNKKSPEGDFFSIFDLDDLIPFKLKRKLDLLSGLLDISNRNGKKQNTNSKQYWINKRNAWAISPFPKIGSGTTDEYVSTSLIDKVQKLMTGIEPLKPDFEFKLGPYHRKPYGNAKIFRTYKQDGIELVNIHDIIRWARLNYSSITEKQFQNEVVPFVTKDEKLSTDSLVCNLIGCNNALSTMWNTENPYDQFNWPQRWDYEGEHHYPIDLFGNRGELSVVVGKLWGFHQTIQLKKKKKSIPSIYTDERLHKQEIPAVKIIKWEEFHPKNSVLMHYFQTPGYEDSDHKFSTLVIGSSNDLENGGIDFFPKEVITKLSYSEESIEYRYPMKQPKIEKYFRFMFARNIMSGNYEKELRKLLPAQQMLMLTESAYHFYNRNIVGDTGLFQGCVAFLRTKTYGFGRLSSVPDPHHYEQIKGAPILTTRFGDTRYWIFEKCSIFGVLDFIKRNYESDYNGK